MPQMYCPECRSNIRVGSKRGERFCPQHPDAKLAGKRSTQTKAPGRKGTTSYAKARTRFASTVCEKRCFFASTDEMGDRIRPEHSCSTNRLEAHHIIEKSWITQNYPDLPEKDFLDIIFNWRIGAPLCPAAHHLVTVNSDYVYMEEVAFECIEFCEAVDEQWHGVLLPSGVQRQSMLERLRLECPERERLTGSSPTSTGCCSATCGQRSRTLRTSTPPYSAGGGQLPDG